ncbi:hypothetical protein B0A48_05375 [Cryoendolithus antarcticus]|uniref:Uncharacterized protein n=1 Tax=Cryoendolithus antarcticus TaxID=1507870 RepID=A0A1V8TID0_9PEZI|nr:hypothetical protein B0A48_05375 [Cryoendolithus antarcticus]
MHLTNAPMLPFYLPLLFLNFLIVSSSISASAMASTRDASAQPGPLDPKTSERQYWRDPITSVQREVWRPGDPDGVLEMDYFERPPPLPPVSERWRLYQSTPAKPYKHRISEPPKNVLLDDRALYEVLTSNIPKLVAAREWSHDLSGPGKLRVRRVHRGRSALPDEIGEIPCIDFGGRVGKYVFYGEKDYDEVRYHELSPESIPEPPAPVRDNTPKNTNKGHNQFTPVDQLVRFGAPSKSETRGKYKQRVNTFLRRSASPVRNGVLSGTGRTNRVATTPMDYAQAPVEGTREGWEGMCVEPDIDTNLLAEGMDDLRKRPASVTARANRYKMAKIAEPVDSVVSKHTGRRGLQDDVSALADPIVSPLPGTFAESMQALEAELVEAHGYILKQDEYIATQDAELVQLRQQLSLFQQGVAGVQAGSVYEH